MVGTALCVFAHPTRLEIRAADVERDLEAELVRLEGMIGER